MDLENKLIFLHNFTYNLHIGLATQIESLLEREVSLGMRSGNLGFSASKICGTLRILI